MRHALAEREHAAVGGDGDLRMSHDPRDILVAHEVIDHRGATCQHHVARRLELRVQVRLPFSRAATSAIDKPFNAGDPAGTARRRQTRGRPVRDPSSSAVIFDA